MVAEAAQTDQQDAVEHAAPDARPVAPQDARSKNASGRLEQGVRLAQGRPPAQGARLALKATAAKRQERRSSASVRPLFPKKTGTRVSAEAPPLNGRSAKMPPSQNSRRKKRAASNAPRTCKAQGARNEVDICMNLVH